MELFNIKRKLINNFTLNELEVSREVENLMNETGLGGNIYFFGNKLPLYITSNWQTIEKRILENEGKFKIAINETPILPNIFKRKNILYNLSDSIEIYQLKKEVNDSDFLFYNSYEVLSIDNQNFYLFTKAPKKALEKFEIFFNKAKSKLEKINPFDCIA